MSSSSQAVVIFPSKVDGWLLGLVAVPLGVSVVAVASALFAGPPPSAALLMIAIEILILGFIPWTFKTTRYTFTDQRLIVRSGPFRWRIEVSEIESIRPSSNPLSSPALSLDRLEIRYRGGHRLLISPKDREGFLEAVVARSRNLVRKGEQGLARDLGRSTAPLAGTKDLHYSVVHENRSL